MATAKKPATKKPGPRPVTKKTSTIRKRQAAPDKPWDACTLAGFGIDTAEYLRSQRGELDDDFSG